MVQFTQVIELLNKKVKVKEQTRGYAKVYKVTNNSIIYTDGFIIVEFKEVINIPDGFQNTVLDIKTGSEVNMSYPRVGDFLDAKYENHWPTSVIDQFKDIKFGKKELYIDNFGEFFTPKQVEESPKSKLLINLRTISTIFDFVKSLTKKEDFNNVMASDSGMIKIEMNTVNIYTATVTNPQAV